MFFFSVAPDPVFLAQQALSKFKWLTEVIPTVAEK